MKKFFQLVLLLGVAAALVLWWRPDLRQQAADQLTRTGLYPKPTGLYKWRDEEGVWQFTQYPPSGGIPYEEYETRSVINVLRPENEAETDD